ncbi:hypothetical protein AB0I28_32940 [Phytomonospora sp. NPDC050363]|uniref:hypothetical protein n=1 Tax=Phytomonospora sp. NPDC050363 TaxID=3155642 RepID=UPI0033D1B66E
MTKPRTTRNRRPRARRIRLLSEVSLLQAEGTPTPGVVIGEEHRPGVGRVWHVAVMKGRKLVSVASADGPEHIGPREPEAEPTHASVWTKLMDRITEHGAPAMKIGAPV